MMTNKMECGKIASLAVAGILALGASATPSVTIDSVLQRWPWNNKVDITYTVTDGQDVSRGVFCKLVFNATIDGQTYEIDGVTNIGASASSGTHTVTWLPPSGIKTTNCSMTATLLSADVPSGDDYMVIDLTSGAIAYEGLYASQAQSNDRYNTATYKTTKMVLRKIPAGGTYPTGYKDEKIHNAPRTWTTDRDYYLGIFGVTQSQYTQLGFSNPVNDAAQLADSSNAATDNDWAAHRPVTRMYYDLLRGSTTAPADALPVSDDPSSASYLQRLNLKTGNKFGFDIPTEVMFEIAARAGATTKYWWGQDPDASKVVCSDNSTTTKAVGLYPANSWGFYDMAGNAATLCRDTRSPDGARILHEASDPWTPVGVLTDTQVHFRQGCYLQTSSDYRMGASNRGGYISHNIANQMSGFRIAYIVQ